MEFYFDKHKYQFWNKVKNSAAHFIAENTYMVWINTFTNKKFQKYFSLIIETKVSKFLVVLGCRLAISVKSADRCVVQLDNWDRCRNQLQAKLVSWLSWDDQSATTMLETPHC